MVRIAKVVDFSFLYQILNRKRFIHIDMVFFFHLVETMYSYRVLQLNTILQCLYVHIQSLYLYIVLCLRSYFKL